MLLELLGSHRPPSVALSGARPLPSETTLLEWHERWPRRVGKSERTVHANRHRLERYILPHLPAGGDIF